MMKKDEKIYLILLISLSFFLRFFLLNDIPGLHFDEARMGLEGIKIIETNNLPLVGQRPYIGNFSPLLVSVSFLMLITRNIFSLRFMFALFGILTNILVYLVVKKTYPKAALFSLAFSTIIPFLVIFSRIGWEFSLIPFFSAMCFFLYVKYINTKKDRYLYLLCLFAGFGIQNQMIFLIIPLFFSFLIFKEFINISTKSLPKISIKNKKLFRLIPCLSLFLLAMSPIIISNITDSFQILDFIRDSKELTLTPEEVIKLYSIFIKDIFGVLDGEIIFLRTSGSLLFYIPYVNSILLIISIFWLFFDFRKNKFKELFLYFFIFYIVFTPIFLIKTAGYTYSVRYFLTFFPLGIIPVGILFSDLVKRNKAFSVLFIFILLLNLFSVSINFFYNIYQNDGDFTNFDIGFSETSSHFISSFTKVAKILEEYDEAYYLDTGHHDIYSILKFLTSGQVKLHSMRSLQFEERGDVKSLYFAVDLDSENKTYEKIRNMAEIDFSEIPIKNRAGKEMIRLYVLHEK